MHLSVLLLPVFGPTSSPMYPKFQGRTGGQFGLSGPGPHHKPKKTSPGGLEEVLDGLVQHAAAIGRKLTVDSSNFGEA